MLSKDENTQTYTDDHYQVKQDLGCCEAPIFKPERIVLFHFTHTWN